MSQVIIGNIPVGGGAPCYVVGEIGINHNGDVGLARKLVDLAAISGCQAVKFQKRTLDVVYSAEELARPRENPFGTTNGDLKRGLEFGPDQYHTVDRFCKEQKVAWFASCWDEASVDFIEKFDPPAYKIASASLTDDALLRHHRKTNKPIILSTGMSTLAQVDHAVEVLGTKDLVILHTTSAYPAKVEDLNLRMIPALQARYGVPIGYSGHETGLVPSVAAVALGACMVERHITLDRAMWGSDHAASVEPQGLMRLVRDIRVIEAAMGDGEKHVSSDEVPIMKKLRRVG
jgi:N-acetylneuraminate synthase